MEWTKWASEQTSECRGAREQSEQEGASERVSGVSERANDERMTQYFLLDSWFFWPTVQCGPSSNSYYEMNALPFVMKWNGIIKHLSYHRIQFVNFSHQKKRKKKTNWDAVLRLIDNKNVLAICSRSSLWIVPHRLMSGDGPWWWRQKSPFSEFQFVCDSRTDRWTHPLIGKSRRLGVAVKKKQKNQKNKKTIPSETRWVEFSQVASSPVKSNGG